jgi:ribonucleotide reductase beta subunit family protein with ferritin-like domain
VLGQLLSFHYPVTEPHLWLPTLVYNNYISNKLDTDEVYELFKEAVNIEIDFINMSLVGKYKNISKEVLIEYVKFTCNERLVDLNLKKIYRANNTILNSRKQSVSVRIKNFFTDTTITDYGKETDTSISQSCFDGDW